MIKVNFDASGFGHKTYKFKTISEAKKFITKDSKSVAGDYNGVISNYEFETVVEDKGGNEIARWELFEE